MAIRLKFDANNNVQEPTFVLANRSGQKLGVLPAYNYVLKEPFNGGSELIFKVSKYNNGEEFALWDKVKDFMLVWVREWDIWFEMSLELEESNEVYKSITAKSLGVSELSQIMLYDVEINTEDDIARDDYEKPTKFYNSDAKISLLNRLLEKAPHYSVKHVDDSLKSIQRSFSFSDKSIYDSFQEVAEEVECLFIINSGTTDNGKIDRSISVYDLNSYCLDCQNRGTFEKVCPKCKSTNVKPGYGKDTTIYVCKDNLSDSINYTVDTDSVKNCFKLVGGDDLMTAAIRACNPNGSDYIWYFSDDMKSNMSSDLIARLDFYDEKYKEYQMTATWILPSTNLGKYNEIAETYKKYNNEIKTISSPVKGYPALMQIYYDTVDFQLFLTSELMPSVELAPTKAKTVLNNLNTEMTRTGFSVAVADIDKASEATVKNAVLSVAKVLVDPRYKVEIYSSSYSKENKYWQGAFYVENYSGGDGAYGDGVSTQFTLTVDISSNYEKYSKQKIETILNRDDTDNLGIVSLFKKDIDEFKAELQKYCLNRLLSFQNACQSCLDALIAQGIANPNSKIDIYKSSTDETTSDVLYNNLYKNYYDKLKAIENEISTREGEITDIKDGIQKDVIKMKSDVQAALNIKSIIGDDNWEEFCSYRRESKFDNSNYISDGLTNAELISNAMDFIDVATDELYKSAELQHSITATLKNLLTMEEFKPIVDYFEVGNWIRVEVDKLVYKLRLIEYEVDFDNLSNINVTFSDVKKVRNGFSDIESILSRANAMATSYDFLQKQANKGAQSNNLLEDWVNRGLTLTKMKIIDDAENQNITWDNHGILLKEYLPLTDTYSDKQVKIINKGLYVTDDNWETSRAGIGDFIYYDPKEYKFKEAYGVVADTLVGNLILSEEVGVYNTENSVTLDKNGLTITATGTTGENQNVFSIDRKTTKTSTDANGDTVTEDVIDHIMYVNDNGELVLNGSIKVYTQNFTGSDSSDIKSLDDLCDPSYYQGLIESGISSYKDEVNSTLEQRYKEMIDYTDTQLHGYKTEIGKYLTFDDENGLTLGASGSNFKTNITNDRLAFTDGTATVAYLSNKQLYIDSAVIESKMQIGKFFISKRDNGGMSINWVDNN